MKKLFYNSFFKSLMRNHSGLREINESEILSETELKTKDELEIELNKVKKILYMLGSKDIVFYSKLFVRFVESLSQVHEISCSNGNYIEKRVKNIDCEIKIDNINGKEYSFPVYTGKKPNLGLLVFTPSKNIKWIHDILSESAMELEKPQKLISISDLTKDDIKTIEKDNLGINLPHGVFYDGNFYRNDDGKILASHPNIENLKMEYVKNRNNQISTFNENIETVNQKILNLYN